MDDMTIVTKLQKSLGERLQQIGDSILAGGVDNMEKYRYAVGQAHAIQFSFTFYTKRKNKRWNFIFSRIFRQSKNRNYLWLCFKDGRFSIQGQR